MGIGVGRNGWNDRCAWQALQASRVKYDHMFPSGTEIEEIPIWALTRTLTACSNPEGVAGEVSVW